MFSNTVVLGGFQARLPSDQAIVLPSKKARALLAYLALHRGRGHDRDKLATLLWADAAAERARHSFRQVLVVLRRALPRSTPQMLVEEGQSVALSLEAVDVDVEAFQRLAGTGTHAALQDAAALYQGDLLEGLDVGESPFEDWLLTERERLGEMAVEVFAKLLAHHSRAGNLDAAIQTGVRLLAFDPAQEAVHRSLMRLYVRQGRRSAALRQYQVCVSALQRELDIEPVVETRQLYQEILRQSAPAAPAATAPGQARTRNQIAQPSAPEFPAPDTPLIGREEEAAELRAALYAAIGGRGRVALVLGEAGIGKTRLIAETAGLALASGAGILLGRCYESTQILPFGPWVEALRTGQVLDRTDVIDGLGDVWRRELARLLPEVTEGRVAEGAGGQDYLRLFEAITRLLVGLADPHALVLAVEDLHWADEMSLRFLAFLGRRVATTRIFVMATARDEELADTPALGATLAEVRGQAGTLGLTLGRLSREATASLVAVLSRTGQEPATTDALADRVWRASQGNPFIAVETLRAFEQGAAPIGGTPPLPGRVRQLITQRLARLGPCTQELIDVAAVIGREFDFTVLHRAAGLAERDTAHGLEELVRRRVLQGVGERFDFTHDRIRDVAYGQLLGPRRKLLHAAVGRALEEAYAANLEPHYAALGTHYRQGEVWEKAQHYLRRAGAQAAARSALQDAQGLFEQALGALQALPDSRSTLEQAFDVRLELRPVLQQLGEVRLILERLREAEAIAERLNDDHRRGRVSALATNLHSLLGELDEAVASGNRALAIAQMLGDLDLRILSTSYLAQAHHYRGDYERVVELSTGNLAALPADRVSEHFGSAAPVSVYDRVWLVASLAELGRFAEASEHEAEGIRLAESTQHAFTIGVAHSASGTVHPLKGDWAKARSRIEHAIAVLRGANVFALLPGAVSYSAWTLAQLGEAIEALNRLREGEQLLERLAARGIFGYRAWAYHALGRAALLLGRLDEAGRLADCAVDSSPGQPGYAAHALHLLGDIATHPDRFDAESGEAHYRKALALAEPRRMRPLVAHCHLGLGALYAKTGKPAEARAELTAAADLCRSTGMTFWLAQAEARLEQVHY